MTKSYLTAPIAVGINQTITAKLIAAELSVPFTAVKNFSLYRRSIDARHGRVRFICRFLVECDKKPSRAEEYVKPTNILQGNLPKVRKRVAVVGSGPAGLFCADYLTRCGAEVTVIERGGDLKERITAVNAFSSGGEFSPVTNVQFGLGGAGTFSDGKLTTGFTLKEAFTVFDEFVSCGAPQDILFSATPHVGTDYLVKVVGNMRDGIISRGGKFLFETLFCGFVEKEDCVEVSLKSNGKEFSLCFDALVLAIGNGARDTFRALYSSGAPMQFKPFAVGVRVEHSRKFISESQYGHLAATHRDLASASYKMTTKSSLGRSCYTFCMCPGGYVVAANSTENSIVVNGMSNYDRLADNSNSAIVVAIGEKDVPSGVLGGVEVQEKLEKNCYFAANSGGDYFAPCQNVADFLNGTLSDKWSVKPSYPRGVTPVNLRKILPSFVSDTIAEALVSFGKKIKGFDQCGVLTAVETRTSSPVRILRDENLLMLGSSRVYPCGEGSGYSGGIVSSAMDGLKVAQKIAENC